MTAREEFPLLHAVCTLLTGLADFRRKKHGKLCTPFILPQPKAGSKRARWNKAKAKSLDTAANKISVAFYKNCVAIFYTDENNMIT